MIDLAAGAWGISQEAAMRKLSDGGVPIPAEMLNEQAEYNFSLVKRRRQANDLWRRSNMQLHAITSGSPIIRNLREKLGLFSRIGASRWQAGPGRMFGAATQRQLNEALLAPGTVPSDRIDNGALIFRQGGWRDVLTLPFFSAPQNLEGFLFVGRDGGRDDRQYRRVLPGKQGFYEGGLFGLDTVEESGAAFRRHVFAVDDAVMALKLQIRHAAQSSTPLPLIAWYDRRTIRTMSAWYSVEKPVVVLGWKLNASVLWSAMQCDGKISIFPLQKVTRESMDHFLRLASPDLILKRALAKAKPWREVLTAWAELNGPAAVEDLLLNLRTYPVDRNDLAAMLNFTQFCTQPGLRTVSLDTLTVIERPSGWYSRRITLCYKLIPEKLFSDVIVRLDYVTSGEQPHYYGRITMGGKTAPFDCPMGQVGSSVTAACIQANLGVPRIAKSHQSLESVAIAFQRPQIVSEEAIQQILGSKPVRARNASNAKPRVRTKP